MAGNDSKSRWKDDSFLKSVQSMLSNEETDTSFFDAQTNSGFSSNFESTSQPVENNSLQIAQKCTDFPQPQTAESFPHCTPLFNPFFDSFDKIFSYTQAIPSSNTQPVDYISSVDSNLSIANVQLNTENENKATNEVDPIEEKIRQIQLENERLRREIEAKPKLATSDSIPIKTADVQSDILNDNTRTDESQGFPTNTTNFSFESDNFQNEAVEFEADFSFFADNDTNKANAAKQESQRRRKVDVSKIEANPNQVKNPFLPPKKANVNVNVRTSDRMNVNGPSLKMFAVGKNNGLPTNIGNSSSTNSISSLKSTEVHANPHRSLQTSMKPIELASQQSSPKPQTQSNATARKLNRKRSASLISNPNNPSDKIHPIIETPIEKKHVTIAENVEVKKGKEKEKEKDAKHFRIFRKRSASTVEKEPKGPIKATNINDNCLIDFSPEQFVSKSNDIKFQYANGFNSFSKKSILKPKKVRLEPLSENKAAIIIQSSYRRHLVLRWFHPELMRSKVAHEFFSTEVYYVSSLNDVLRVFLTPLRKAVESGKQILSYEEIDFLFSGIERIASFSQKNLSKIKQRIGNWRIGSLFGDVISKMCSEMGDIYSEYIVGYENMIKRFESMKTKSGVKNFFIKAEALYYAGRNRGHDMTSFLILPVQRPPRYLLLLKEMLKWTHPSHKDYKLLSSSADSLSRIVSKADEDKGSFENDQKRIATLAEIAANFEPKLKDFATEKGRRFIDQAKFFEIDCVENVIRDRVYLIFSDVIIFAKQNKKRQKIKTFVSLNLCSLKLIPSVTIKTTTYNHCLEFYTNVHRIVIGFHSEEEKMKFYDTCLTYSAMKRF